MQARIVNYDVSYADETPVQVLKEPNKRAEQLSTMWLYIGGKANSIKDGIDLATNLIDSGKALKTLNKLIEISNYPEAEK